MNNIKNVIIFPICGFANRLRFINSCVYLFREYDITPTIYWLPSKECNINHSEIFQEIKGLKFIDNIPENYLFFGHIHLAHVIDKLENLNNENPNGKDTLIVTGSHEYKPVRVNDLTFISHKQKLYENIIWNKNILAKILEVKNKLGINDNNYITLHYRCLDNRFDSNDLKNSSNINFNNNSPISEFERYVSKISNSKIILISNKNDVVIDNVLRISNEECDRNKTDSMIQSIIEFKIMCDSRLIIGSYFSSFSDEASFFNLIPKVIPYDIRKIKINSPYHCSGISFINGILALNYSTNRIIDCLEF